MSLPSEYHLNIMQTLYISFKYASIIFSNSCASILSLKKMFITYWFEKISTLQVCLPESRNWFLTIQLVSWSHKQGVSRPWLSPFCSEEEKSAEYHPYTAKWQKGIKTFSRVGSCNYRELKLAPISVGNWRNSSPLKKILW